MLNKIDIHHIAREFKKMILERYEIIDFKIFGSSARGEYSEHSDIDIMVKLPLVTRQIEEDIFNTAYEIELGYNCLIDVVVVPENVKAYIPVLSNIAKEGVSI